LGSANRVQDHQTTGYAREVIAAVVSDIATLGVHRRARIAPAGANSSAVANERQGKHRCRCWSANQRLNFLY
jgi:hypothetical protein